MKICSIFEGEHRRRLFSNMVSLSFLQATNYIVPLVALPYLVRVLGDDRFGLVMFSQAFIQYFLIVIDFGFELTATREISVHRNNREKLSEIFSAVFTLKILLIILSLMLMTGVVFSIEHFRREWALYYLGFGMVIGQMMFPIWFFQGIERMRYIMVFNLLAKILFTCLLFVFIHRPEDYHRYAIVNSGGYLLAGIVSFIVAIRMDMLRIVPVSSQVLIEMFKKTYNVFLSNVGGSLYMTATPLVLGLVTGRNDVVGYYTVAEKAVRGIRYSVTPVTQALFPYLSLRFLKESPQDSVSALYKIVKYLSPLLFLMVIFVLIFANEFTRILTGGNNPSTVLNMRIISGILLVGTVNNVLGVLGMINLGMEPQFRNSILFCGAFNLFVASLGAHYLLDVGAALSLLATETLLAGILYIQLNKKLAHA